MNSNQLQIKFTLREKISIGIIVSASALSFIVGVVGIVGYITQQAAQ
jgi:hypothetical protein